MKITKKQKGATLIEMLLVLGVLTTAGVYQFQQSMREFENTSAKGLGNEITTFSAAVSRWIADNQFSTLPTSLPDGASVTYNGVSYLKHTSCGGTAEKAYLPCSFNDKPTLGGLSYTIKLKNIGNNFIATNTFEPLTLAGTVRGDLAAVALSNIKSSVYNRTSLNAEIDPLGNTIPLGSIHIEITAGGDEYLSVDGSNYMQGVFAFNPSMDPLKQRINNVNTIIGSADDIISGRVGVAVDNDLYVGGVSVIQEGQINHGGAQIKGDALIESSLEVKQTITSDDTLTDELQVNKNASIGNNLTVNKDTNIKGDLDVNNNANIGKNLTVNNNLIVKNNGSIDGDLKIKGNTTSNGRILSNGYIQTADNIFGEKDIVIKNNANIKEYLLVEKAVGSQYYSVLNGLTEKTACVARSIATDINGHTMHCIKGLWEYIVDPIKTYWIGNWDAVSCWGTQVTNAKLVIDGSKWSLEATLLADYSYRKRSTVGTNGASVSYANGRDVTQFEVMPDGRMRQRCKSGAAWKYANIPRMGWLKNSLIT